MSKLDLEGRSHALATERPPGWECLLFAQVILDYVGDAKAALSRLKRTQTEITDAAPYAFEFSSWGPERMEEIKDLVTATSNAVDGINERLDEILGLPGQSGNLEAIVSSGRLIGSFCTKIIDWASAVSTTPVHPIWQNVPQVMVDVYALPLVLSIEQFAREITEQIQAFVAAPSPGETTLKFSLRLDVINTDRLMNAIDEANEVLAQRVQECARLMKSFRESEGRAVGALQAGNPQESEHHARQAIQVLSQVGNLGILWPPGGIPEKLIEELIEPVEEYGERLRHNRELAERLLFALQNNDADGGRALLRELARDRVIFQKTAESFGTSPDEIIEAAERMFNEIAPSNYESEEQIRIELVYPNAGHIYLLINPSMDGLVKIGKTSLDPADRAKQLGAVTGVPTPFIPIFYAYVSNCSEAEAFIHACLDQRNCRVSPNREFFRVSPTDAIEIMLEAKHRFPISDTAQENF